MRNVLRHCQTIFQGIELFISPTEVDKNSSKSVSLPTPGMISPFNFCCFNLCVVVSHCGFNVHFPGD